MFKILVSTKFRDRVVNYVQTVGEHVGTMREDACQCVPCHDCHELPWIVPEQLTSSSRVVPDMLTSSSRTVHEQFTSSSRLLRDSGARVGAWVYTWLPRHCPPFQRSPAGRHAATTKQTKWHDLPRQNRGQKSCKCQPCI